MEKVTSAQIGAMTFKKGIGAGVSATRPFYEEIIKLGVGEGVQIAKAEWPNRSAPNPRVAPKDIRPITSKYSVKQTDDETSWVVIRTV